MRDAVTGFSNRVFDNADALLDHCCVMLWNKLEAQPWTIMSIGLVIGPMGPDQKSLGITGTPAATAQYVLP